VLERAADKTTQAVRGLKEHEHEHEHERAPDGQPGPVHHRSSL
jgi:hypothetical protein